MTEGVLTDKRGLASFIREVSVFGEIRSMLHGGKKLRSDVLRASYAQDPVYYQEVVLPS